MEQEEKNLTFSAKKHEPLSLKKGISQFKVTINWEENTRKRYADHDFDIDLLILETDSDGKLISPNHLVCYATKYLTKDGKFTDPYEAVIHSGDDTTGGSGEECICNLKKLGNEVKELHFLISIYEAKERNQTFSMIKSSEVEVFEENSTIPKIVYNLNEDFSNCTIIKAAKLQKVGRQWQFVAIGEGYDEYLSKVLFEYGLIIKESNI